MKRFSVCLIALAIAALLTPHAWAQRGPRGFGRGGGGSALGLLQQKSVQEELKLSAEQVEQAADAMEKLRESMADFRDLSREERQELSAEIRNTSRQALAKILSDAQQKRLRQIALQQSGPRAFADPKIAEALALTDQQKQEVQDIQDDIRSQARELFQGAAGGDRDEIRKQMESLRTAASEKLEALLTTEQQAKWKEQLGEPFEGEITRPQFRGRGGRPGAASQADRDSNASTARGFFRLANFQADDDDDDGDGDDDNRSKAKKSHGKKAKNKGHKAAPRDAKARRHRGSHPQGHDAHARGGHCGHHAERRTHGPDFSMRRGGGPHADIRAHGARAMADHPRQHGRSPSFGHPGPGGFHGHAHHRVGPRGGFGPAMAHHGWHHPHGPRGPAFGFDRGHPGHRHGHGPAHFASHRGPHPHHGVASWHMRNHGGDHHRGPGHFDRGRRDEHGKPHGPPRERDHRRSEAGGPEHHSSSDADRRDVEATERLAQLERSLDLLARQIEELRRSLRR